MIQLNLLVSAGGPLCDGDIEDADGVLQVFCPWHDYDFNLRTGKSNTGLQVSGMSSSSLQRETDIWQAQRVLITFV